VYVKSGCSVHLQIQLGQLELPGDLGGVERRCADWEHDAAVVSSLTCVLRHYISSLHLRHRARLTTALIPVYRASHG